ncbi:unnamed protein product [Bursaphelenchus okinawaensis]|uniref:MARVEL domain-containing protein n=1 Tax=Bursaphelenchus okinawaensis TaxID=465554 RepID=A0A811K630_9BILA|nr:unnamed protein product [Bursaphelenchus okinawaensis]CAG9093575.1 unnamed protein product [Bursaphelenchus okinawaensis]
MNLQRFAALPNALKPGILVTILFSMILTSAAHVKEGETLGGGWFFWLTIVFQFVFMIVVCILFMFEAEQFLTMGRDAWPVLEMGYSAAFFGSTVIDVFIVMRWVNAGTNYTFVAAVFCLILLALFHAASGALMYKIWRGMVRSGTTQNPTSQHVQPGDIGNMHPGV